jgi:hypothetical protein
MTTKCTKWQLNIPNGHTIDQMAIKYCDIFHCTTLPNLPKLVFLVWHTIWQPVDCATPPARDQNFVRNPSLRIWEPTPRETIKGETRRQHCRHFFRASKCDHVRAIYNTVTLVDRSRLFHPSTCNRVRIRTQDSTNPSCKVKTRGPFLTSPLAPRGTLHP